MAESCAAISRRLVVHGRDSVIARLSEGMVCRKLVLVYVNSAGEASVYPRQPVLPFCGMEAEDTQLSSVDSRGSPSQHAGVPCSPRRQNPAPWCIQVSLCKDLLCRNSRNALWEVEDDTGMYLLLPCMPWKMARLGDNMGIHLCCSIHRPTPTARPQRPPSGEEYVYSSALVGLPEGTAFAHMGNQHALVQFGLSCRSCGLCLVELRASFRRPAADRWSFHLLADRHGLPVSCDRTCRCISSLPPEDQ